MGYRSADEIFSPFDVRVGLTPPPSSFHRSPVSSAGRGGGDRSPAMPNFFIADVQGGVNPYRPPSESRFLARRGDRTCSDNFSRMYRVGLTQPPSSFQSESRFLGPGGYRTCSDNFSIADVSDSITPSSSVGVPFLRPAGGHRTCSDNFSIADVVNSYPHRPQSESRFLRPGGYRTCSDNFSLPI